MILKTNLRAVCSSDNLAASTCTTISMNPDTCPLCGGESEVVKNNSNNVSITCKTCRLSTRSVRNIHEFSLIQEWNTRHSKKEKQSVDIKYILFFACMIVCGIIAGVINYFLKN
jgi:hypothetical protein